MANPLPNEEEIYKKIKEEKLTIHPLIWELISHHIRNDLQVISLGMISLFDTPRWILKFASFLIKFLYKLSLKPGEAEDLISVCQIVLERTNSISLFLRKLRKATLPEDE